MTTKTKTTTKTLKKARPKARGRYATKGQGSRAEALSSVGLDPEEHADRVQALARALEAESRVRGPQARRTLTETLAAAALAIQGQARLHAQGRLTSDEARGLPALVRSVAKLAELASVTEAVPRGDCMTCAGACEIRGQPCQACDGTGLEGA